jgi:hypothetical protein
MPKCFPPDDNGLDSVIKYLALEFDYFPTSHLGFGSEFVYLAQNFFLLAEAMNLIFSNSAHHRF